MGRDFRKILALTIAFMLTISGMTVDVYGQTINEVGDTEDPFALMVDTTPELMTVGEIIRYAVPIGISRAEIDTVTKVLLPSDYEDVDNVKQILFEKRLGMSLKNQ